LEKRSEEILTVIYRPEIIISEPPEKFGTDEEEDFEVMPKDMSTPEVLDEIVTP